MVLVSMGVFGRGHLVFECPSNFQGWYCIDNRKASTCLRGPGAHGPPLGGGTHRLRLGQGLLRGLPSTQTPPRARWSTYWKGGCRRLFICVWFCIILVHLGTGVK